MMSWGRDECHCACHRDPSVKHIMPCCIQCMKCGARVKNIEAHIKEYHSEQENNNDTIPRSTIPESSSESSE